MKKYFAKMDKLLFVMMILFSLLGLLMIFSASSVSTILRYNVSSSYFFFRQALFLFVSFFVGIFIVLRLPTFKYKYISWFLVIVVIVALIGLFVYGVLTNDVLSWYNFGKISIQPSEFAKSILIVFMAVFYDNLMKKGINNIYLYLIPLSIGLVMAFLVAMQPDFGSAAIILGISFLIFISVPAVKSNALKILKILGVAVIIGVITFLYSGSSLLNSAQLSRLNFKKPCSRYTEETGYQVCNGFIAIKNGGLFGVGLGNSTQKYLYLPESHTDFIFPIIVEELGLIGGVIVLGGYLIILLRVLKIAREADNLRCSILAYGVFLYLLLHITVNLLGILALIPLTGLPLPFLSYGGSYIMNVVVMLFVVERVAIENKINKAKREIERI